MNGCSLHAPIICQPRDDNKAGRYAGSGATWLSRVPPRPVAGSQISTRSRLPPPISAPYNQCREKRRIYDICGREVVMRTIVHAIYVSLDGVVSDPMWTSPFFNDELGALQRKQ